MEFDKPVLAYAELWPMLVVFGVAVAGVLVEAFLAREHRFRAQVALTLLGLVVALAVLSALVLSRLLRRP